MPHPTQFILYIATTLDGYIASPDGRIDWLTTLDAGSEDVGYEAFYNTIEALVMGAATYEQVLTFGDWPYAHKPSYVMTRRQLSSDRPDVTFVSDVETVLAEVERQGWQRVWLVGGGQVAAEFMRRGLVHEWIVAIAPIILGDGISLYQQVPMQKLQLVNSRHFQSGMVELHYTMP
ncbi:dihydrofolate reductase family protein [Leptolyngbya iicbica]|uniref:Dihydrofolate reductase n=2 Tax=Cyanophyceae TaxID=3028117 RepID=A0A4Q7E5X1_9CYAN|nr:dihydrofolate reductase family protein [Leptolyngbya sp. LK]RZM77752.1 dihydrofolate reductase [Leptolyngbya sp. LK]